MPPKQQQQLIRRAQGTPKSSTSFNKKNRTPSRNGRRGRSRSQSSRKSSWSTSQTRRRQIPISWTSLSNSKDSRNSSKSYKSRDNWSRLHTQTCKFWNNSRCTKGENCEYSHFHLKFFHKTQNFETKGKAQLINQQYQQQINDGKVLVEVKQLKFMPWTEVQQLAQNLTAGVLEQAVSIATINKNAERNYKKELKQLKQFDDDPTHALQLKVNAFNKFYDKLIKIDRKSDAAKKYKSNKSSQQKIDLKQNSNQNQNQSESMDVEYMKTNQNNNQKKNNQKDKSPHNENQSKKPKNTIEEEIDFDKKEIKPIIRQNNKNSENIQKEQKNQKLQQLNNNQNEIPNYKVSLKSPKTSQEYLDQNESDELQDNQIKIKASKLYQQVAQQLDPMILNELAKKAKTNNQFPDDTQQRLVAKNIELNQMWESRLIQMITDELYYIQQMMDSAKINSRDLKKKIKYGIYINAYLLYILKQNFRSQKFDVEEGVYHNIQSIRSNFTKLIKYYLYQIQQSHTTTIYKFVEGDLLYNLVNNSYIFINEKKRQESNKFLKSQIFLKKNTKKNQCKSKIATNSLQENKINLLSDFPSASPDLNPIENIWAYIKHILAKKSLTNLKDLEEEIIKIWDNLDQEIIDNCIDSMSTRLQKCIELQGRMTEY